MEDAKWLAGAFSAYGLVDNRTKNKKVSLFTSSGTGSEYVEEFNRRVGLGRVQAVKGRWEWVCDEPAEVQQFYRAVGPHLMPSKRRMIEVTWETWRKHVLDASNGEIEIGTIDDAVFEPQ